MNKPKKTVGFFVSLAGCALAVAAAACYGIMFPDIQYKEPVFDVMVCVLLAVSGVIGAALLFFGERTAGFGPAVLCLGSGMAFLNFIKMVIWPIADTIYGIEPFPQFTQLVICAVMILLTFVVSEVALYMKKYRADMQ